jgi:hypothetical protein
MNNLHFFTSDEYYWHESPGREMQIYTRGGYACGCSYEMPVDWYVYGGDEAGWDSDLAFQDGHYRWQLLTFGQNLTPDTI